MDRAASASSSRNTQVAVIGAGIVGLSSALWLLRAGYRVTIIDRGEPGEGTSYGNAGVLAGFARLPFTRFSMLCKIPKMLMDPESPLSISGRYIPELVPYGWNYFKSCFNYKKMRAGLSELQSQAFDADQVLLKQAGAQSLVRRKGSLGLFADESSIAKARKGEMRERQQQGVRLEFYSAAQVRDMEPALAPFYAGGVYYPDTRFTVSPIELSRSYARCLEALGGRIIRDKVNFIDVDDRGVNIQTSLQRYQFDQLVVAAGASSRPLVAQLGLNIPLVSERGYHLMIDAPGKELGRPVAWLDKAVFVSPMEGGIRMAGTAEFAAENETPQQARIDNMKRHARSMLGEGVGFESTWVGSRPSTPDSLPVIGSLPGQPRVTLAFGHGHLGLTLGAITGKLVAEIIQGIEPSVDLKAFSPVRFS